MTDQIKTLHDLGKQAVTELDTKYSVSEVEPIFLDILLLLKNNMNNQKQLSGSILSMLDHEMIPFEAIQFCMRELQWQEVKLGVITRLKESDDLRVHNVMNKLLEVFDDEWEDEDLYRYYMK
jgi:hypothetical protein